MPASPAPKEPKRKPRGGRRPGESIGVTALTLGWQPEAAFLTCHGVLHPMQKGKQGEAMPCPFRFLVTTSRWPLAVRRPLSGRGWTPPEPFGFFMPPLAMTRRARYLVLAALKPGGPHLPQLLSRIRAARKSSAVEPAAALWRNHCSTSPSSSSLSS